MNPYQPPQPLDEENAALTSAQRAVRPPALGLIILGCLCLVGFGLQMIQGCFVLALPLLYPNITISTLAIIEDFAMAFVFLIVGYLLVRGSLHLRRFSSKRWAYAACIVGLIPQPLCIFTTVFSIWGLLILRRADVKAAFAANAQKKTN